MFYEDNIVITQIIFRWSSIPGRSNWNFEMLIFAEGGKPENEPGEKPSKQGRESTTNSTHI
jgi:hypothetical protein